MSIIKNSMLNLSGILLPTICSIPALGYLARQLGTEFFGIYTIAIAIVGYSSIFDIGLTRALVREISIHRDDSRELDKIIATAGIVVFTISFIGSILVFLYSKNIVEWLNISSAHLEQAQQAISILSFTIPIFLLNQVWLAIPEGKENFKFLNVQRVISSVFTSLLPALFVFINDSLFYAMLGLALARVISIFICYYSLKKDINSAGVNFSKNSLYRLITFGGWLTVSNIISPVMTYFDRFIVSNLMGASYVAFYTAPSEAVMRLTMLPGALGKAIFPRLSKVTSSLDYKNNIKLSYKILFLTTLPLVVFIFFMSKWLMVTWMGEAYGGTAKTVLQILIIGFFFNSLAQIPFTSIQALGKAKYTAIIHLLEVVPYLFFLYFCVNYFGIIGAAIAWTARVLIDFMLLAVVNNNFMKYLQVHK